MLWKAHACLSCPTAGRLCEEGPPKAGRTPAANRASGRVQSSPLPASLAGRSLASRAYHQWPVDKSRRGVRRLPRRVWFSLVAHDSGDVTALGDFFQMSRWGSQSINLDKYILAPNSFRSSFLVLVDTPRQVNLTVNPGVRRRLGHSFALGSSICGSAREAQARSAKAGKGGGP